MSQPTIDYNDPDAAERWERIMKVENLQADTLLKLSQTRFMPWQIWSSGLTAGAAVVGAAVALGHWL